MAGSSGVTQISEDTPGKWGRVDGTGTVLMFTVGNSPNPYKDAVERFYYYHAHFTHKEHEVLTG